MKNTPATIGKMAAVAMICTVAAQASVDPQIIWKVPDATGTFALLGLAVAGLVAFRRRSAK